MRFKALISTLLLVAGSPTLAAGVDGSWVGAIKAPDGTLIELKYSFKADGAKLSGTAYGPDGAGMPIAAGKVDGSNVSFVVEVDMGGQKMILNYTGVLAGNEIKLRFELAGAPIDLVVKRVP